MKSKLFLKGILIFSCAVSVLFLFSPIVALIFGPWKNIISALKEPLVFEALRISIKSTTISLIFIILFGLPTSYLMARYRFFGKKIIETIFELPLVLPPAVAGLLLLITFGRNGLIGKYFYILNIQIPFTFTAVVMAQIFVGAPIFLKTVRNGLEKVDRDLEITAATLGDSPWRIFKRVTLPLAWSSILTGALLAWARALAEFGATIMFAGNLQGKTQTLPLAIYTAMEKDLNLSLTIAAILVGVSLIILTLLKFIAKGSWEEN